MYKTDISVVDVNEAQLFEISESQVPNIIQNSFTKLKELNKKAKEAEEKAKSAKTSADSAKEMSAGWGKKKAAIESLQNVAVDLADAQVSSSEAITEVFHYQEEMSKTIKYLFSLGVTNIAMNRSVVRELELKLKNASEEELGELAQKEIITVIRQLKAQEDIMQKQAELSEKTKMNHAQLEKLIESINSHIANLASYNNKQDSLIKKQDQKSVNLEKLTSENKKSISEYGKAITEITKKYNAHDKELKRLNDEQIEDRNARVNKETSQDETIDKLVAEISDLKKQIDECQTNEMSNDETILLHSSEINDLKEQIAKLTLINADKDNQIYELKEICNRLAGDILSNNSLVTTIEEHNVKRFNNKANKISVIISYLIGAIALVVAIIEHFL